MPLIEMPLDQLRVYQGRNPCPPDMDAYWDAALAEMRAVDPKVELVERPSKVAFADCFEMRFAGVRGARIYCQLLKPRGFKGKRPALLLFHGYSGHSGDWAEKYRWAAQGFVVAAMDCRGQGGKSEDVGGVKGTTFCGDIVRGLDDKPENMTLRHIFLDTAELARIVMEMGEVDPDRVGATGGSQGGGLTLACAALEPRIRRAFSLYPFLCDYQRVWEMDLVKVAYEELRQWFRNFDPLHQREREVFTRLGYLDIQHLAKRIKAEVRMATGLMDTDCPASTQFAAYNRITSKKSVLIYPDFGHEGINGVGDQAFEFLADL
jgi:cephalosporin-C deacetylase